MEYCLYAYIKCYLTMTQLNFYFFLLCFQQKIDFTLSTLPFHPLRSFIHSLIRSIKRCLRLLQVYVKCVRIHLIEVNSSITILILTRKRKINVKRNNKIIKNTHCLLLLLLLLLLTVYADVTTIAQIETVSKQYWHTYSHIFTCSHNSKLYYCSS